MQYKTIILELLQQRPRLHDQLRSRRELLAVTESYARMLKTRHEAWMGKLAESKPLMHPANRSSAAMEIALVEVVSRLQAAYPPDEQEQPFLDAVMAYLRTLTLRT
ncbi:MAG: hypothetical protein IT449_00035 [Phycisphaerales bacterium]|nr:hypothetical protein [Phycisphaerales bacterium]